MDIWRDLWQQIYLIHAFFNKIALSLVKNLERCFVILRSLAIDNYTKNERSSGFDAVIWQGLQNM